MNLEKGTCIFFEGCFYVVVKTDDDGVYCICDNANNQYYWTLKGILGDEDHLIISALKAAQITAYGCAETYLNEQELDIYYNKGACERGLPTDVIHEVLVGQHDDRWG